MTDTSRGGVALTMLKALQAGQDYPASVPDTPANRQVWDSIRADIEQIKAAGQVVDIPVDYTEQPPG